MVLILSIGLSVLAAFRCRTPTTTGALVVPLCAEAKAQCNQREERSGRLTAKARGARIPVVCRILGVQQGQQVGVRALLIGVGFGAVKERIR
jgi:hypothetical protein